MKCNDGKGKEEETDMMAGLKQADIILFMGQSNMAGRGCAAEAPEVRTGTGYEFRAVSSPERLYPLKEPFGKYENDIRGVYEPGMKTGSMVSSFVNAYFKETGVPVIAVSCAKGGSSIRKWLPGTSYYQDAVRRMERCEAWCQADEVQICHRLMVWCQGCTDGDLHTDPELYRRDTERMIRTFQRDCKIEICFLIQIGNHRDDPELYVPIQKAERELAENNKNIVMVSTQFAEFAKLGLMKDQFHYKQKGYNLVGEEAGKNAGRYLADWKKKVGKS